MSVPSAKLREEPRISSTTEYVSGNDIARQLNLCKKKAKSVSENRIKIIFDPHPLQHRCQCNLLET